MLASAASSWHHLVMPGGVRARAREALLAEVSNVARRHLSEQGASGLSVRAISRELELAPSALYRYYPSRDALLTQLIIEAYDALGEFVESHERARARSDHRGRFTAAARAIRTWAVAHPHEYALLYGSPVPGYAAPEDTIGPATRVIAVLIAILADADTSRLSSIARIELSPDLEAQVERLIEITPHELDPHVLAFGAIQWATFFGMVSFELFGTYVGSFDDAANLYDHAIEIALAVVGW